jgi:hypothetical protein
VAARSAGILLFRRDPGGAFYRNKDAGLLLRAPDLIRPFCSYMVCPGTSKIWTARNRYVGQVGMSSPFTIAVRGVGLVHLR